jgi:CelD/BcsL family acetyltransferase involved in cellulose biosynthesis
VIRLQILDNASEFQQVRSLWDRFASSPGASIFQQFHWNRLAAERFREREQPHVIVATCDDDAVIFPLAVRTNGTVALLGETLFDYRDFLSTGDADLELVAMSEASRLGLPLEITALAPQAAARWNHFQLQPFCHAPRIVRANCSAEHLVEAHRRLGRHSRRIAARGVQLRHRAGTDREFIRDLYMRKAVQTGSLFSDPLRREFMEHICNEEGERCRIFTYETSTNIVAAILTFQHGNTRHFYTVYFDPAWAAFSPGQVLLYEACVQTLAEGLDCDLLTGEYPYKTRLASDLVPLVRLQATAADWQAAIVRRHRSIAA